MNSFNKSVFAIAFLLLVVGLWIKGLQAVENQNKTKTRVKDVVVLYDAYSEKYYRYQCDKTSVREFSGAPTLVCYNGRHKHTFYGLVPMRVDE